MIAGAKELKRQSNTKWLVGSPIKIRKKICFGHHVADSFQKSYQLSFHGQYFERNKRKSFLQLIGSCDVIIDCKIGICFEID